MDMEPMPKKYLPKIWIRLMDYEPDFNSMEQTELGFKKVPVKDIIGTDSDNHIAMYFKSRFDDILNIVKIGEYDPNDDYPPTLFELDGKYFVASDGNHRVLVFKYLRKKFIIAEVSKLTRKRHRISINF